MQIWVFIWKVYRNQIYQTWEIRKNQGEKMKKYYWLMTVLLILGLALSACGSNEPINNQNVMVEEPEANAEESMPEPMEEEPAVYELSALDEAYAIFLADMEKYNTIGLEALNTAMAEAPPFILDVRAASEAEEKGHIEGSILIPLRELAQNLAYLPSFGTPIVSYCGSGWRCTIASTALEAMGWEDVTCLKGGSFGGWVEAGYAVVEGLQPEAEILNAVEADLAMVAYWDEVLMAIPDGYGGITAEALNTEIAENADLIVIDARRADEVATKGFIDAANWMQIPLESFIELKADWPADLDAPIVINCGSGHRSTQAMTIMMSYGYTNVRSLKSGFGGWAAGGFPTAYDAPDLTGAIDIFLDDMEGYNTIGLDALNAALAEEPPFLLDVRAASEAEEKGHIPGAILIPLRDLAKNLAYLPSFDTSIVTYCGSGWRCTIASVALEALGWEDVKCLKGSSFGGWAAAGYEVAEGVPAEGELLNAAKPYGGMVELWDETLTNVPDGYGGITADALNTTLAENADLILIDVRKDSELTDNGVIEAENWMHIPLEAFADSIEEWPADKDAPIVVYCGSGHRSTLAMTILWSYGYTNVTSLKGGFGGWASEGFPVLEYVAMP